MDAWLERIRDLYRAHDELGAAWQDAAAPAPQREEAAAGSRWPARRWNGSCRGTRAREDLRTWAQPPPPG